MSRATRRGKEVGEYYDRYAGEQVRLVVGRVEGRLALGAFTPQAAARPAYFMFLEWRDGRVQAIRDYRYVPYIADEAEFEAA